MSLGLVILEKLFTRMHKPTPQSDDIKMKSGARNSFLVNVYEFKSKFLDKIFQKERIQIVTNFIVI